jgi:hypothetical protein
MDLVPVDPATPVPPGCIRFVHLQEDGRLQPGDQVATAKLGVCTVAYIRSVDSICVKTRQGHYYNLSGFGLSVEARLASRADRPLKTAG